MTAALTFPPFAFTAPTASPFKGAGSTLRFVGVILVALLLFGTIALADVPARAAAVSQATDDTVGLAALQQVSTAKARKRARCEECGVISAIRRIESADGQPVTYEITVRLHDGSMRTNRNATPGNWHAGDRIMLIKGGIPAHASSI